MPAQQESQPEEKTLTLQVDAGGAARADGDTLFGEYLQHSCIRTGYRPPCPTGRKTAKYLNETERQVYDALKTFCTEVADGKRTETNDW